MASDLDKRFERLESKLDAIVVALGEMKIHAAVCDRDRLESRAVLDSLRTEANTKALRSWRLITAIAASGALGGGASEIVSLFL